MNEFNNEVQFTKIELQDLNSLKVRVSIMREDISKIKAALRKQDAIEKVHLQQSNYKEILRKNWLTILAGFAPLLFILGYIGDLLIHLAKNN